MNPSSISGKKKVEELNMLESIVIIICVAVCLGAAIFAWWMENGPERHKDDDSSDTTIFTKKE